MINRTIVRTKVIQILYAYYQDGDKTPLTAKKELLRSFDDTYDLYALLLDFVNELTTFAEVQIEQMEAKAKVTHKTYIPNRRFVNNQFALQIFNNSALRNHLSNSKLCWDAGHNAVVAIYKQLVETPFYQEYMQKESVSYEDDKLVWRKIFSLLMVDNPQLESALEEMEIVLDHAGWTTDLNFITSFVVKTIRHFDNTSDQQALLPMFSNEEELSFAKDLLQYSIEDSEQYATLINAHLKNWEANRIALMDRVIIQVALAEIIHFPDIAIQISMNEYIELSKEYSSDKSYTFVNGILTEILQEMKAQNKLLKAMTIR